MYFVFILFKNLLYLYSLNFIFVVFAGEIRDYIYITLLKVDYCFINWSCGKVRKGCVYRGAVFYLVLRLARPKFFYFGSSSTFFFLS